MDLTKSIEPKSDQLNADDLIGGKTITIKITKVSSGNADQPIRVDYEGGKPFYPCKSMRRVLVTVWGTDGASYVGKSLTLYRDPDVKFGGIAVGGLRISHMSHITETKTMPLTASKGNKKLYTVKPLESTPAVDTQSIIAAGETAAKQGMDVYKRWFTSISKEAKQAIEPSHEKFKKMALEADESKTQEEII